MCIASHPDTRMLFVKANIPFYLYPFLSTTNKEKHYEYLRLTSLGVIGALVKVLDPYPTVLFLVTSCTLRHLLDTFEGPNSSAHNGHPPSNTPMANPSSLPLHERITRKNTIQRAFDLILLFLLFSLLVYRIASLNNHGFTWLLAFMSESWFTFLWLLTINTKWNQVEYKTYPDGLSQRVPELPPVDIFVTTVDPMLEPPIITVNTVISLLAIDYPANKLACYVSNDGGSPLTFYSLVEASKFAKLWVPFCKKYNIPTRAPFRYFCDETVSSSKNSSEFKQEWKRMKEEYDELCRKIEEAVQKSKPCDLTGDFIVFSNIERKNHPSIIKVIWENKEGLFNGLPHLVYVSREKHPKHPHHYKAGAMNALTRISGVMTNAPFMLNVDCDMFANNPQIVFHAMCLFLGIKNERDCAFVQSPQIFYDGLKDDPFGNQFFVLQETMFRGMAGIQAAMYQGTNCFHRRKVIYGLSPNESEAKMRNLSSINGKFIEKGLDKNFGNSMDLTKSMAETFSGCNVKTDRSKHLSSFLEAAHQVATCEYEYGTNWGTKVGWIYGSAAEDNLTGMKIHARGWGSVFCTPDPPAFQGCAPSSGPATMTQMKRWSTGFLEILFSRNSPFIIAFTEKLQFRWCLGYLWIQVWGLRSIPKLCYTALPAYCIITNSNFLPKVQEQAIFIPIAIFVVYNFHTLLEYIHFGLSINTWWNNQRMERLNTASARLFGFLSIILKLLGLSETTFEVTQKDQSSPGDGASIDTGRFTFDESPIFVVCTAVALVHLTALVIGLLRFQQPTHGGHQGSGLGEFFCGVWVVLMFSPFVKGLFGKGKYGIPSSTIYKSVALALLFVGLCVET